MSTTLRIESTPIEGMVVVHLPIHGDNRGWFKEHWQRAKMVSLGLPDFGPVQQNISFNAEVGTTRGIHAEPWDKYVSVAAGKVFGAWVDLREGDGFGTVFTHELNSSTAVFVPRGVANAFQTLEPDTAYMYLVNDHWSPDACYTFLNVADPTVNIAWPIDLSNAILSDKDRAHPLLENVSPMKPRPTAVIGVDGQLGRALKALLGDENTHYISRDMLDLEDIDAVRAFDMSSYATIINAAAFTAVDAAETDEGARKSWVINASAVAELASKARDSRAIFVHVSTDYVFSGDTHSHQEDEPLAPLNVYGQSKAAGEYAARIAPKSYVVRTSWVVGDGKNFVRTMASLAGRGVAPSVIDDQFGRLTFASELARALVHLVTEQAPYGTYNMSNDGPVSSWFDVACEVFALVGADRSQVSPTSTREYCLKTPVAATRPHYSTFDLTKIKDTGFTPEDWRTNLIEYLNAG